MKPIFNGSIRGNSRKTTDVCVFASLIFLALVQVGRADTTNFTGDFAAAFWNAQPQSGTIGFSNANTQLVIAGPNKPAGETTSTDPITYNGPTSSGLVTDGTVEFDSQFVSPLGLDSAILEWTPPGGSPMQIVLGQLAGITTNSYSIEMSQGTTFEFVLFTDTPANKNSGSLTISDFQFHANIPEPSTGALLAGGAALLAGSRRRRARR